VFQSPLDLDAPAPTDDALLHRLLRDARPAAAGHHDELFDQAHSLREPWRHFLGALARQAQGEAAPGADAVIATLARHAAQAAAQVHQNGVSYNAQPASSQPAGAREWPLGVLPLIVGPEDWRDIAAGVIQRAQALEAMLEDSYGAQHLVREGLLPPALAFTHPGYLHALHGAQPLAGPRLHVVAFDLARGPDARWCVVDQRTQAPSGMGYALENRLIVSRLFPEAFRDMRVQRLASAYRRLLDTVQTLAGAVAGGASPRIALLTPGPSSETYFEHAYLARYLGVPLVEGGDLTVRGERVYLKTVQGLEPVHGLLRRLDDDWCDPLELRADSALGVPGLLQAVRRGHVVVSNALGAGFLESPALFEFLPAIARRLLGRELLLPSAPTFWCGGDACSAPIASGFRWLATWPGREVGRDLPRADDANAWRERALTDPESVTQRFDPPHSQTPFWNAGARQLQLRSALLRVYAVADAYGRFEVMPGGMTRVAPRGEAPVSMQQGCASVDTWVLTEDAVDRFSMLPPRLSLAQVAEHHRPVSSRVAENLFWMGRYTERIEFAVRLLKEIARAADSRDLAPAPLMRTLTQLAMNAGLIAQAGDDAAVMERFESVPCALERSVSAALAHTDAFLGLAGSLGSLAGTARALRDRLSPEHARLVLGLGEGFAARISTLRALPGFALSDALPALQALDDRLAAVTGAQVDRMTRDDGWRLMMVGRLIERLMSLADTLGNAFEHGAAHVGPGFEMLLALFDSALTYRARYPGRIEPIALLDLLVADETSPRSLAGVLRWLRAECPRLPASGGWADDLQALLPGECAHALGELCDPQGLQVDDAAVCAFAQRLVDAGAALSNELGRRYFALAARHEHSLQL
jgi:uncharacterized circularly permuted ATP-grasp superfamily protein/uncharacterized alpha-E superfamily protein